MIPATEIERRKIMKKWIAMFLAVAMMLSLAACGGSSSAPAKDTDKPAANAPAASSDGKQEKIVLWTLANDLKQFAERYTAETGNEVEVVVFDSADFSTKIMQTLGTKSKDVDVFVGEPQMLPNFFEGGFCADLSEFDSQVADRLVGYTREAGTDADGVLRAISYQATPGSVIYRRDLAKEVFGTDDPAEIGKHFSSFNEITKTAEALSAKGYSIFGDTGSLRWFSLSSNPWVKDGKIIVDQDRLDYFDCAVELYQKGYVANANEWSAPWYASMAGPLPLIAADANVWEMTGDGLAEQVAGGAATTQVFSYVMPSWGALIVRDNAKDNNPMASPKTQPKAALKSKGNGMQRLNRYGALMCLPFVIAFCVFNVYPVFRTLQMSFMSYKGFGKETFIGFQNYIRAFKDVLFRDAFVNTLKMWGLNIVLQLGLALLLTIHPWKSQALGRICTEVQNSLLSFRELQISQNTGNRAIKAISAQPM